MKKSLPTFYLVLIFLAISLFAFALLKKFLVAPKINEPTGENVTLSDYIKPNAEFNTLFESILKVNPSISLEMFKPEAVKDMTMRKDSQMLINKDNPYWSFSPDGKMAVSTWLYYGEPDLSLDLYNRKGDNTIENLAFCGTPCRYWGTLWLDNNSFVFIYDDYDFSENNEGGSKYNLYIDIYNLKEGKVIPFVVEGLSDPPKIPQWNDWLEREKRIRKEKSGEVIN